MIKVVKGDLLNETNGILVHGLSARLVMASGIAESIRQMYPVVYMDYNLHCRNLLCSPKVLDYDDPNKILLGEVILSEIADDYRDWETDRKSTRLNSSHSAKSRMPSSA